MILPRAAVPIQAMPQIRAAKVYITDIMEAVKRAEQAWNKTQLMDALSSAERFIEATKNALEADSGVGK